MAKNLLVTYILWLVLGWLGVHHIYLRRDRQALVWFFTCGGCFGLGWFRDFVRIPEYIDEANEEREFIAELRHKAKIYSCPPFQMIRFAGEIVVGMLLGFLFRTAVPEEILWQYRLLDVMVPLAVATGVHLVGNIGHEKVSMKMAVCGSVVGFPIYLQDPSNMTYMALVSSVLVNTKEKSWRLTKSRRHVCWRFTVLAVCALLYSSLWASTIYHNTYVTLADGEKVKVHVALKHFFNSPAWAETKNTAWTLWRHYLDHGFHGLYDEVMYSIDPEGEVHAYKVLGLQSGSSEKDITAAYRKLVRQWHPDKHKDPVRKKEASEVFMEIQEAYETLSSIKARRAQRNTRQRWRAADDEL